MSSAPTKIAQVFLCGSAFCLLVSLLIPWGGPTRDAAQERVPGTLAADPLPVRSLPERVSPAVVSSLFVPPQPAKPAPARGAPPAAAAKKPIEAPWLSCVGFFSTSPGTSSWILKDSRSGRLIVVSRGVDSPMWSLVEVTDTQLIVRSGDDRFVVRKR